MQNKENLEYRMYGLVPYNISDIQKGIQFGHAVVEYGLHYGDSVEYKKWATEDKTFIILNGGTTSKTLGKLGTLNQHATTLVYEYEVPTGIFLEPDLGDQLTAVVFLVDERVWNKQKYPDPPEVDNTLLSGQVNYHVEDAIEKMGGADIWRMRLFLNQFKLA